LRRVHGFRFSRRSAHRRLRASRHGLDRPQALADAGALAVAVLARDGAVSPDCIARTDCVDELRLDGFVRAVPGVVPARLAGREPVTAQWLCREEIPVKEMAWRTGCPAPVTGDRDSETTRD
jgi:predicted ATPase with chaperone activity